MRLDRIRDVPIRAGGAGLGAVCALAILVGGSGVAFAQSSMGAVNGTVKDSGGGVVAGATVALLSEATNIKVARQTDKGGYFNFVNVRPGPYVLTVQHPGFSTVKVAAFAVGVHETVLQNVSLTVGNVTETIDVVTHSELIQASSAELGQVVEEKVISELPLQGRNFTSLLMLTPGVNPVSTAQGPSGETSVGSVEGNSGIAGGAIFNASVMGQQNRSKIYYVDGIINSSMRSGTYVALPDIDSLQEFKVQSQSDKAEFGGVMGGVVNMTSKSGTNRLRGSAFAFLRDQSLTARNSYRDATTDKPEFKQQQFGANVGGAIIKDKTFFFVSYDGWRFKSFTKVQHIVPLNDAYLNGDFTQQPVFRQIYNPYSTRVEGGKTVRDPFMCDSGGNALPTDAQGRQAPGVPCNKIPQSLISPTMRAFLQAYMPRPNLSGSAVVNSFNYSQLRDQKQDSNAFQVRIDHHFSANDNLFVRWTERRINAQVPVGDLGFKDPDSINRNAGAGWFHSFTPNMVLEVRGGFATQPTEDAPLQHPLGFEPQRGLGLPELDQFQGYVLSDLGTPWNLPQLGQQGPRERGNPNWNAAADLTWLRGKHSFKAGVQLMGIKRLQKNQFGEMRMAGDQATRNPQATSNTGDTLASALLGLPSQVRGYLPDTGYIDFRSNTYSTYLQDQWAVKPNLTLSLGLRYDYVGKVVGGYDGMIQSGPDLATGEWLIATPTMPVVCDPGKTLPPCLPTTLDKIPYSDKIRATGERNSIVKPITDNWGPRIGLAWQINDRTVVRTGYSLMWDALVSRSQYGQHQYENGWPIFSGIDTGTINTEALAVQGSFQKVDSIGTLPFGVPTTNVWGLTGWINDPDRKDSYSHQWHIELQREVTRNLMVGIAYVGSYNGRMEWAGRAFAAKTVGVDATGRRLTAAERDLLRPWPYISSNVMYSDSTGMSKYNGLQIKVQQRFSQGLSSMLSYTYSRTVDTSSGLAGAENGIGGGGNVQNYWDQNDARAVASYDVPHILSWATVWELPLGRGKRWLSSGPASWILGNWQLNWMLLARSGQPMTITVGGDPANIGPTGYSRANAVPGVDPVLPEITNDTYLDKAAYATPVNSFGDSKRNAVRGPSFWNVDAGLQKNIPLGGDRSLELRLEAFNVFNHINDGNPNTAFDNVNFGRITGMTGLPRQLQFGVRFVF